MSGFLSVVNTNVAAGAASANSLNLSCEQLKEFLT